MKYKILSFTLFWLVLAHTSQAQFNLGKVLEKVGGKSGGLSENEIVQGLKEALNVGISNGSDSASKVDGFFKNELIKIAVPPEAQKVAETLRKMGLGEQVDKFTLSLNRAAEDAANEVTDTVVGTFQDARRKVEDQIDSVRQAVDLKKQQVHRAMDAGRAAAREAREELEQRIAETKAAYGAGAAVARGPRSAVDELDEE